MLPDFRFTWSTYFAKTDQGVDKEFNKMTLDKILEELEIILAILFIKNTYRVYFMLMPLKNERRENVES